MEEIEVIVQSILPSEEPQGRFHIKIHKDATVSQLLKELCRQANMPIKPEYSIRSKGNDLLSRGNTLSKCEIQDGSFLHWTNEEIAMKTCSCNTLWFLAILSCVIGFIGIAAISAIRFKPVAVLIDYAIVFDAGSSHTSMFVYKWEDSKYHGTAVASQWGETCTAEGGGISSYENNPYAAGASLDECLKKAGDLVPHDRQSETPIYLGATAGMRLLNISNPKAADAILESVRLTFEDSSFYLINRTTSVRIITGADEGTFSWITSNYLTNAFNIEQSDVVVPRLNFDSIGAMDLGGASTQITFIPAEGTKMPRGFSEEVTLFGEDYTVYTYSYLCYGVVQMRNTILATLIKDSNQTDSTIMHSCLPKGYNRTESYQDIFSSPCVTGSAEDQNYTFIGTGNTTECRNLLSSSLFNKTTCPYSQCSFNGVYQPTVQGPFFAFSTYYYVASFLNLTKTSAAFTYGEYMNAVRIFCNKTWTEIQQIPASGKTKSEMMWYCLEGEYISLLVHDNFNFTNNDWKSIYFVNEVADTEVGWTLGFVLKESDDYAVHNIAPGIYPVTFGLLMALFILFLIVAVGLAVQARRVSRQTFASYSRITSYGAI